MQTDQHTILVVDDNVTVRDLLNDRLEHRGFRVLLAANGRQALDIMRAETVHLVLLDIMMPGMDGYEVLARMKADAELRRIHVVVMSALHEIESIVKCVKLGAEDYLFKPFNSALFWARINASLEKRRLQDQERAYLEELRVLQQIDLQLNSTLELKEVAQVVLDWAGQQTQAVAGVVGEFSQFEFETWAQFGLEESTRDSFSSYRHYLNFIQEKQYLQSIRLAPETTLFSDAVHRVYVPIRCKGEVLGYLILDSQHYFTDSYLNFLSRLSSHAAIAVNNARLHAKAREANLAKSNFMAYVVHELKSPLSSLMIYAGLMDAMAEDALLTKRHEYAQTIVQTINRMDGLIAELTDIARIETGQWELNCTAVSLRQVVKEVLSSFTEKMAEKGQTVSVDFGPALPSIWADSRRLAQIMTNLVSNAHKYTPSGGTITIKAWKKRNKKGAYAEISVADDGIGIAKRDREKIFNQFYRAESELVTAEKGVGLGLYITKQIVEKHGGHIWLESELGQGTTFFFTIPLVSGRPSTSQFPDEKKTGQHAQTL